VQTAAVLEQRHSLKFLQSGRRRGGARGVRLRPWPGALRCQSHPLTLSSESGQANTGL